MKLFLLSFTRYLIRDSAARRSTMFYVLLAALLMVFLGSTWLAGALASNLWWFVGFWLACGWLTLAAFLLAMYDLAALRHEAREERRRLRRRYFGDGTDATEAVDAAARKNGEGD